MFLLKQQCLVVRALEPLLAVFSKTPAPICRRAAIGLDGPASHSTWLWSGCLGAADLASSWGRKRVCSLVQAASASVWAVLWASSLPVCTPRSGHLAPTARRPRSPGWHRRLRLQRARARANLRRGTPRAGDRLRLLAHHGSMPPKAKEEKTKGGGSKGSKSSSPTTSTIKFVPPATVISALQSRAGRLHSAVLATDEATVTRTMAQEANFVATQIARASKRLESNVKAKQELAGSAFAWFARMADHLLYHLADVERQGKELDVDTTEALQLLSTHINPPASAATQDLLGKAQDSLGAIWGPHMPNAVQQARDVLKSLEQLGSLPGAHPRLATVGLGSAMPQTSSASTLTGAPPGLPGTEVVSPPALVQPLRPLAMQQNRWSKRTTACPATEERPSKSPRTTSKEANRALDGPPLPSAAAAVFGPILHGLHSEEAAMDAPWAKLATGLTPPRETKPALSTLGGPGVAGMAEPSEAALSDTISFQAAEHTEMTETEADWAAWQENWIGAWTSTIKSLVDTHGLETVTSSSNPKHATVLPDPPLADLDETKHLLASAMETLITGDMTRGPAIASAVEDLLRAYECLRSCPGALTNCPKVLLLLGHILSQRIGDAFSFNPQSTEEWLYPELVLALDPSLAVRLGGSTLPAQAQSILQSCSCPFSMS